MQPDRIGILLSTQELGDWLDRQGPDRWWLIDGDPLLTSLVSFPCTGDEIAIVLRKINKSLFLLPRDAADPSELTSLTIDDIDRFAFLDPFRNERMFRFRWDSTPPGQEWMLLEDKKSAELARSSCILENR
jgi:hypothetical protein